MRAALRLVGTIGVIAAFTAGTTAAQTINIGGLQMNSSRIVGSLSDWKTGQTFTPLNMFLNDFTFWMELRSGDPGQTFTAHVAQWDPTTASISALLWSGGATALATPALNVPEAVTFGTGGITLDQTAVYVAFLTHTSPTSSVFVGVKRTNDNYSGGQLVQTTGAIGDNWSNTPLGSRAEDAWGFEANFSGTGPTTVPEPGTIALVATGLVGLGIMRRRKKNGLPD